VAVRVAVAVAMRVAGGVLAGSVLAVAVLGLAGSHRLVPFGAVTRAGCWAI
jgi:hypothetical protein